MLFLKTIVQSNTRNKTVLFLLEFYLVVCVIIRDRPVIGEADYYGRYLALSALVSILPIMPIILFAASMFSQEPPPPTSTLRVAYTAAATLTERRQVLTSQALDCPASLIAPPPSLPCLPSPPPSSSLPVPCGYVTFSSIARAAHRVSVRSVALCHPCSW